MSANPELDLTHVDRIVSELGTRSDAVVAILQAIQQQYRFLPQRALERVCELTQITPASIAGVSTFYTHFRHRPVGQRMVHVCRGTACHVKGAELVQGAIEHHLGLTDGEDTDAEGRFTVQPVACLGCCTLAPVVQIDGSTYGRVSARNAPRILEASLRDSEADRAARRLPPRVAGGPKGEIRIGLGSCCQAQGSGRVHDTILSVLDRSGAAAEVKRVGCIGMCHQTPLMQLVAPDGGSTFYAHVQPQDVPRIVLRHFRPRGVVRRLTYHVSQWLSGFYTDEEEDPVETRSLDIQGDTVCAFLGPQKHVATEYYGGIDPVDLDEYVRHEGFVALKRVLAEYGADKIIAEVRRSGLRGRGGAGFPTYVKWQKAREAAGSPKYVICNGDEGDPGAFMDRMLLESFPYRVLEGMAIAARAVGAHDAILYIRTEYPLALERVRAAIAECESRGFLGERVLGTDWTLRVLVMEGAGAFICGEETALINSLEGRRGTPRLRPPYPVEVGFRGLPTLINNVESLACVPWILRHGGDAFAAFGTAASKGTKVFALAGKVRRGGLIEVPMGVTVRQIVEQIGGGVLPGRTFKAVQVGGPSGGCVPASLAETPVDYEALSSVGAIMGSGGLVVLDDTDCMVDIARYFLRFTQDQSCGKCTFCRIGTKRMLEVLDRICTGKGHAGDLTELEQLARSVVSGSICGLGKTAPNPVLSTLTYFRAEYEAHLAGRCP
ncbi:MAG: proton-conducting membrane transporter, partial [Planctomycetes bacterium]|nr:proton-conducting membrane transporter [Planctomycetota bacterium]